VRLLLDEMISFRIARQLRNRGHDVVAIKRDRPDLARRLDSDILRTMAGERRAVVTNNVRDFRAEHERMLAAGETHYGIVFTLDAVLPRNKASVALWVRRLDAFLRAHPDDDALRDKTHVLT
jgi:predicted nuclease of predicted toxin-antitoxin system